MYGGFDVGVTYNGLLDRHSTGIEAYNVLIRRYNERKDTLSVTANGEVNWGSLGNSLAFTQFYASKKLDHLDVKFAAATPLTDYAKTAEAETASEEAAALPEAAEKAVEAATELAEPPQAVRAVSAMAVPAALTKLRREIFFIMIHSSIKYAARTAFPSVPHGRLYPQRVPLVLRQLRSDQNCRKNQFSDCCRIFMFCKVVQSCAFIFVGSRERLPTADSQEPAPA